MPRFDLEKYDTVESRIEKFWGDHPNGRILTRMLSDPNALDEVVVQAEVYADRQDERPVATGLAFEKRGKSGADGANLTSHLENCETSAIGRAFANWVFKAKKDSPRPSREEMRKVNEAHNAANRGAGHGPRESIPPINPTDRAAEEKEQIHAFRSEVRKLAENSDNAHRLRTSRTLLEWAQEIAPGLAEMAPNPMAWSARDWRTFRDCVVTSLDRVPVTA